MAAAPELKRSVSRRARDAAAGCIGDFFGGFKEYILRGNVVDLAVAVVVGNAFTALVASVVSDWLTPTVAIMFNPDAVFDSLTFKIRGSIFPYGHFLNTLLSFVLILIIVITFVVAPMQALLQAAFPSTKMRPCPECLSEIPTRASRCKFCCTQVEPIGPNKKLTPSPSKLVRHGSAPAPQAAAQQPPDRIMARAQTLPVGTVLPAGIAVQQGASSPQAAAGKSPFAAAAGGSSKAAPLQSVPEDSCPPVPSVSASPQASAVDVAAAGAGAAVGEAAADVGARGHTSRSQEAGSEGSQAGDALAKWEPTHALFRSTSVKVADMKPASDYSWLSGAGPAGTAPTAGSGGGVPGPGPADRHSARGLFRSGSSKVSPETAAERPPLAAGGAALRVERSSASGRLSSRSNPTSLTAAIAIDIGGLTGAGMG